MLGIFDIKIIKIIAEILVSSKETFENGVVVKQMKITNEDLENPGLDINSFCQVIDLAVSTYLQLSSLIPGASLQV